MDTALAEAFWHAEHRVFGRRLLPLTLRHCFVLATADNPVVTGSRMATDADLIQLVEICSRPSNFFLMGKRPSWFARQWTWLCSLREKDAFGKVAAYFADYTASPEVWSNGSGKGAKAHHTLSAVAGLAHWLHIPIEQAWETSPGAANWLIAAAIEQSPHASIDIIGETEKAIIAKIEAERRDADGN